MLAIAIRIKSTNDKNGNPRRGWAVYRAEIDDWHANRSPAWIFTRFVDEGCYGNAALREASPDAAEVCTVNVASGEARDWRRRAANTTAAAPFLVPQNAGLGSTDRVAARVLGHVLSALGELNELVAMGEAPAWCRWFRLALHTAAQGAGWRITAKDGGGWRVLPPQK